MKQKLRDPNVREKVLKALAKGTDHRKVAEKFGLNYSTVRKLSENVHKAGTN